MSETTTIADFNVTSKSTKERSLEAFKNQQLEQQTQEAHYQAQMEAKFEQI